MCKMDGRVERVPSPASMDTSHKGMASRALSVHRNVFLCVVALFVLLSTFEAHAYKAKPHGGYTIPTINFLSPDLTSEDEIGIIARYPDGAGPFPAAVVFHGCLGLRLPGYSGWTNWFHRRGYAVFFVDSWRPRGISESCRPSRFKPSFESKQGKKAIKGLNRRLANLALRFGDAWAAVRHIAGLPGIRADRIVAIGFSHGGNTVFDSVSSSRYDEYFGNTGPRYAAAIAFYGSCFTLPAFPKPYAPLLIIAGSEDRILNMFLCHQTKKVLYPDDDSVQVHTIQGAYHGFDRPAVHGSGRLRTFRGRVKLKPDRKATEEARALVDSFLTRFVDN